MARRERRERRDREQPKLSERNRQIEITNVFADLAAPCYVAFFRDYRHKNLSTEPEFPSETSTTLLWLVDESARRLKPLRCRQHGEPLRDLMPGEGRLVFTTECTQLCFPDMTIALLVAECFREECRWGMRVVSLHPDPAEHHGLAAERQEEGQLGGHEESELTRMRVQLVDVMEAMLDNSIKQGDRQYDEHARLAEAIFTHGEMIDRLDQKLAVVLANQEKLMESHARLLVLVGRTVPMPAVSLSSSTQRGGPSYTSSLM